jgi:hypothetical protein
MPVPKKFTLSGGRAGTITFREGSAGDEIVRPAPAGS